MQNQYMNKCLRISFFLLFFVFIPSARLWANVPDYQLSVTIDPDANKIYGLVQTHALDTNGTILNCGRLKINTVYLNGRQLTPSLDSGRLRIPSDGELKIKYEGVFQEHQDTDNVISQSGIALIKGWYPEIKGLFRYHLSVNLPKGWTAVSEADEIKTKSTSDGIYLQFIFPYPVKGIHLAADRYTVVKDTVGNIALYGYFPDEDVHLADTYLAYAKDYILRYQKQFGIYPYRRFSIVTNIFPTGYAMPTFTLLGKSVIRLPFIVETALGHEVLHQWFGNSVYVDHACGNWSEGLTTYLADHQLSQDKQAGWHYRKNILINYASYVTTDNRIPLNVFITPADSATRAVGYGKGAMFFHMLNQMVGEETFYRALKFFANHYRFQMAGWPEIRQTFETYAGIDLKEFFNQWLNRDDIIQFKVTDPRWIYHPENPVLSFNLLQELSSGNRPFHFDVDLQIITDRGMEEHVLKVSNADQHFEIPVKSRPNVLIIDPDYDLMRMLVPDETPPTLSYLFGDQNRFLIVDPDEESRYDPLIHAMQTQGFTCKTTAEINQTEIENASLLLLGCNNKIFHSLFGQHLSAPVNNDAGVWVEVKKHPLNSAQVIASICAENESEANTLNNRLLHYGKYTSLTFKKGRNIEKSIIPTNQGIRIPIETMVQGIETRRNLNLETIIDRIQDTPIIYIGESHSDYEDHRVQFRVIQKLHQAGKKIAVGLEMFQRPFQPAIDDYLEGKIDERQLLKRTEYYTRWRFDYYLYREIINYAKANQIPIVALNILSEITHKVAREGFDALTTEEGNQIPQYMDFTDTDYSRRLQEVFKHHQHTKISNSRFNNFLKAQILWDETMARSIAEYLKKSPDVQMVVLAGSGHIMYGSGIPKRALRRTGRHYKILLNAGNLDEYEPSMADYILFPRPISPPPFPKIGIIIQETDQGVEIKSITPNGPAEIARLESGDIVLEIDDFNIETVADVKIALLDRKRGDNVKIVIQPSSFLFRSQTEEKWVRLQ